MKVISYNINGIRAAIKKGLINWLKEIDVDVICFQEIKANKDQFDDDLFIELGYHCYWYSAEKKVIVEWQYYVKKSLLKSLMELKIL